MIKNVSFLLYNSSHCDSDLEGGESLHHLGDTVLSDGVSESRPGRRVGELGATGEQWMTTLGAHIHTCRKQLR